MKKRQVLLTGASGEIGHSLIERLDGPVLALDLREPEHELPPQVEFLRGDITDREFIGSLADSYSFSAIFHLAALLSSGSEQNPVRAHEVNVNGSLNLLELARLQSERQNAAVQFLFASTAAVYGIRPPADKMSAGKVSEDQFLDPVSMYGINKLYVEHLGRYFYQRSNGKVDFRAIRFPGILSADTVPTSGTSDYGPLMLHAAAKGEPYSCFVSKEAQLNFIAMPDAVEAFALLAAAPAEALSRRVYNVTGFSVSAAEILEEVLAAFPQASVQFEPVEWRDKLVGTWPLDTDDSRAAADWGWRAHYDRYRAFQEYLVPGVRKRYRSAVRG